MSLDSTAIERAADLMVRQQPVVFLTGAGVSVESGIPDFRSPGGLWERFDPAEYASIHAFRSDPHKVWRMLRELERTLDAAAPNPGHVALARLEERGIVSGVITQNIDNLHQEAGSRNVVEFHGNGRHLVCLRCGVRTRPDTVGLARGERREPPECFECGAILKPDVVFFGESIPEHALNDSFRLAASCGVMAVAGTSATVMPCSALPFAARQAGAALVEINLSRTEISSMVDLAVRGPWGEVMPALAAEIEARLPVP
jgi:NAD-dependent deacetylase